MVQNAINAKNRFIQFVSATVQTLVSGSTTIPADDTIPQKTEGDEIITVSITPTSTTTNLLITFETSCQLAANAGSIGVALFQDTTSNALAAQSMSKAASGGACIRLYHVMASGTTSSTTFKIRAGTSTASSNFNVNGTNTGVQTYGGRASTTLTVMEYL